MTTRHSRQGGSVLLCLLTAVLLAGCGGAGGDQADPTPSFSPQPTAASSSSSPVSTSSSASPVQETPEAFVRRWVTLQTAMQNSGETEQFRAVSTGCDACLGLADLVDHYYMAGGLIRTKGWSLQSVNCKAEALKASCQAQVANASTVYKETAEGPRKRLHGGPFMEAFEARQVDGQWVMEHIAELAQ